MVTIVQTAPQKQCTCGNCKAVLSYSYQDMRFSLENSDYTGTSRERVARIVCPACGNTPQVSVIF